MIASIKSVNVFVNDSTKAHDFYANKLGFEVRSDITIGNGYRWLEVLPKGSQTAIVLAPPEDGQKVGAIMNIILTTDDIQATYKLDFGQFGDSTPELGVASGGITQGIEQPLD